MALEILSTLSSKRLSFPDSTTINTKNTVLPWQLAERSSQKVKQYYCFLTQCQGPSYHLYHTERERKAFWVNLPACQLQTPGTTPFPVPPPPVLFSLQVAIWAPKISKNSDTSSLRPLRERSILWLGLFRLFPASPLLHREALCCQAGCRGRDREEALFPQEQLCSQPPLSREHPHWRVKHESMWPNRMPQAWHPGHSFPCPSRHRESPGTCPLLPARPVLRKLVSTQNCPKLILHLSAAAVERKISVRQENIWKLHPIGGEGAFFNKRGF